MESKGIFTATDLEILNGERPMPLSDVEQGINQEQPRLFPDTKPE